MATGSSCRPGGRGDARHREVLQAGGYSLRIQRTLRVRGIRGVTEGTNQPTNTVEKRGRRQVNGKVRTANGVGLTIKVADG